MSSKNETRIFQNGLPSSPPEQRKPRSLRLRLVFWYGLLVTCALIFFAILVLILATEALDQSIASTVHGEVRAAESQVSAELLSKAPYWPAQIHLQTPNTYQEPGIVVEVIDKQGTIRYASDSNSQDRIPIAKSDIQTVLSGRVTQYQDGIDGEQVQVEAVPILSQSATSPVIGLLVVAKSRSEIQSTLHLFQALLAAVGLTAFLGTLLGGWVIAARVLSPLAEMARTARSVAATTASGTRIGDLHQRIRRPPGNDEMVQVIDTLNDMLSTLEQATYTQQRFVADASHELRAPLTTIQGNLAFLQRHVDELPPVEQQTMLSDAYEETLRLAELVEQLLLLARSDANSIQSHTLLDLVSSPEHLPTSIVELDHVVLQLVRQLRGRLATEDEHVRIDVGHIEPIRVRGDEELLRRVMLILLDNAIKYMPSSIMDEEEGHVTVSLERKDREAVLQIHDTGIGIDPADLPHIFERFYRADRARTRQGTGLGLSIAQTLVIQLNGRITAESLPDQGSTFRVWLPLA